MLVGFLAVLILFSLIIGTGLYQNHTTNQNVSQIVRLHGLKTELITQMYNAARERSICLFTMVSQDDPFKRDEAYLRFNGYAAQFARARIKLKTLSLTKDESDLLQQQAAITRKTVPIQTRVADMANENRITQANKLLIEQAVPLQDNILSLLLKLQNIQHTSAKRIAYKNQQQQHDTFYLLIGFSLLAFIIGIAIIYFVVRIIRNMERRLFVEKEMAEITLHSIGDAVMVTDKQGMITKINPMAEKLTGYHKIGAIGRDFYTVFNIEESAPKYSQELKQVLENLRVISTADESRILKNQHGVSYSIEYTIAPVLDDKNNANGAVITFRDVTEIRALSSQLKYYASHDNLTGLINRREFEGHIKAARLSAINEKRRHLLCFTDLEKFKFINDTAGHAAGDEFLKQITQQMHAQLRSEDVLARLGGDEFGILLLDCDEASSSEAIERINNAVKEFRFAWASNVFDVGISIGMVEITEYSVGVTELLSHADTACYTAKREGRNRVHLFDVKDKQIQQTKGEIQWVQHLKAALEQDALVLYAQPIIGIRANSTQHYEVLVRLKDDNKLIQPMSFIPAAERYGLMPDIDKWVISKTLSLLQTIKSSSIIFTINLSGQSISEQSFFDYLVELIKSCDIAPERICFEITETAAISNLSDANNFIATIKKLGCKFALDDFGSGLSSFSYLKNMPVDYLKIDGNFILDVCDDPTDFAFVEAINRIGKLMGIETVAEFVENEKILEELKKIGLDYAQGYYFGEPELLESIIEKINSDRL